VSLRSGKRPSYDGCTTCSLTAEASSGTARASPRSPPCTGSQRLGNGRSTRGELTFFEGVETADTTENFGKIAHRLNTYDKRGTLNGVAFAGATANRGPGHLQGRVFPAGSSPPTAALTNPGTRVCTRKVPRPAYPAGTAGAATANARRRNHSFGSDAESQERCVPKPPAPPRGFEVIVEMVCLDTSAPYTSARCTAILPLVKLLGLSSE